MLDGVPASSWWFLATSLVGLWFTAQAVRPVPFPRRLAIPSFFAGWLANELVVHHVFWQTLAVGLWVWLGALGAWPGWLALGITLLQWALALGLLRLALRTPRLVERALRDCLGEDYRDDLPELAAGWDRPRWLPVVVPALTGHPDVQRRRDVPFARVGGRTLHLDVFTPTHDDPPMPPAGRPALVYLHGGAWTLGFRSRQGLPILTELARRGWVGIQPAYRLSPVATYPEHLHDAKRAVAWVRAHADELGVDPSFVAVVGGSAGGHLASLVALTPDRPDLQPGFEQADTSVQAAVPFYGVYDVDDERLEAVLARLVIKADRDEDPQRWRDFTPMAHVHDGAPPTLVVHGDRDTLTSPQEAGRFVTALAARSDAPVGRLALPGAQHGFDLFPSIRTGPVILGVARFLAVVHARRRGHAPQAGTPRRAGGEHTS